jgi:hypothetical protein
MAIYHATVKTFSRSKGHSAVAAAAYRAGVRLVDERTGVVHNYTNRRGVVAAHVLAPDGAPAWVRDSKTLWNRVEAFENRKNSSVAHELEVSLPNELESIQRQHLANALGQLLVDRYGAAVLVAVHAPSEKGDERNHHTHLQFTTRRILDSGFGEKLRVLHDLKTSGDEVRALRAAVADLINAHLAAAAVSARVDHRSLAAQAESAAARGDLAAVAALSRVPQQHEGKEATALARRGAAPYRRQTNHHVRADNRALAAVAHEHLASARRPTVPTRWRGTAPKASETSPVMRRTKARSTGPCRRQPPAMPRAARRAVRAGQESFVGMLQRVAADYRASVAYLIRMHRFAAAEAEALRARLAEDGRLRRLVYLAYAADRQACRLELQALEQKRSRGAAVTVAVGRTETTETSVADTAIRVIESAMDQTAPQPASLVPVDREETTNSKVDNVPSASVGDAEVRRKPDPVPDPVSAPGVMTSSSASSPSTRLPSRREWAQRRRAQRRAEEAAVAVHNGIKEPADAPDTDVDERARQARVKADRAAAAVRQRLTTPPQPPVAPPVEQPPQRPRSRRI